MHEKEFLTEIELAKTLGLSESYLRKLRTRETQSGLPQPPVLKFGRKVMYERKAVLAWVRHVFGEGYSNE